MRNRLALLTLLSMIAIAGAAGMSAQAQVPAPAGLLSVGTLALAPAAPSGADSSSGSQSSSTQSSTQSSAPSGAVADAVIPIYARHFSTDDIQGLIQFYESPLGQRVVKTMPQVTQESESAGIQLDQKAAIKVLRGMQDEYPELKQMLPPENGAPGAAPEPPPAPGPALTPRPSPAPPQK